MSAGNRRDTLSILSDLLDNMQEPRRITSLLYATNLSYSQFARYLKMVREMGLAQVQHKQHNLYQVTNDGKFFINLVKKRIETS
jgi:predicted transcriptional regulator